MSAIGSFILLPKSSLDGLRGAAKPRKRLFGAPKDIYWDYLRETGREVADYDWSGYVLATLLEWLKDQRQTDLRSSEHGELAKYLSSERHSMHCIFSKQHKDSYLEKLDPSGVSIEELCDYYNEFNETNEPDAGLPMIDGLRALHQSLSEIDDASVVLLIVG
jgi:hypothetical protein